MYQGCKIKVKHVQNNNTVFKKLLVDGRKGVQNLVQITLNGLVI